MVYEEMFTDKDIYSMTSYHTTGTADRDLDTDTWTSFERCKAIPPILLSCRNVYNKAAPLSSRKKVFSFSYRFDKRLEVNFDFHNIKKQLH